MVAIPAERGTPPELFPSTGRVAERAPRGSWNLGVSGREHGSDCSVTRTDDPDHSFATERPISDPAGAQQATSLTLSDQLSRTRHEFEPRWSLRWLYLLPYGCWLRCCCDGLHRWRFFARMTHLRRWFFMQQPVEQRGREASADEQGRNAVAQDITRAGLSRKDGAPSVQPGEPAERSQRLVLTDLDSDGCPGALQAPFPRKRTF